MYRKYFDEVFDFTDANNYKLSRGVSGVVFNYLKSITGNSIRDIGIPNRTIDDIKEKGLNINNYNISFSPPIGITKYTLCIVFTHWRNRSFTLTKYLSTNNNILVKLDYNKSNKKVTLTVNKTTQNFTMLSSFNEKFIVLWLAENLTANVTKVSISNYSGTLTIPAVNYNANQLWEFTTEMLCNVKNK